MLLTLLLVVLCASAAFYFANFSESAPAVVEAKNYKGVLTRLHKTPAVWKYNYQTHDYIFNSYGGMVHSESCQCKETRY